MNVDQNVSEGYDGDNVAGEAERVVYVLNVMSQDDDGTEPVFIDATMDIGQREAAEDNELMANMVVSITDASNYASFSVF